MIMSFSNNSIQTFRQKVKAPNRQCIVSAAFDPPCRILDPMRNKLARLNEQLLLRTLTTEQRRAGFYIGIPRDWWLLHFGSGYRSVQKAAESIGMIQANRNCKGRKRYCNDPQFSDAGTYPASYRLTADYRDGSYYIYEMSRKPRLKDCDIRLSDLSDVGERLARKLPLFSVDQSRAIHAWDALTASFINRGTYWASECEFGRLHTTMTGASKELRSTTRIKNNVTHMDSGRLVELDIVSCQPLLLASLVRSALYTADSKRWFEKSEAGCLYEDLLAWVKENAKPFSLVVDDRLISINPAKWDRKKLKKNFMFVLFGDHPDVESNPVWLAIDAMFPSVAKFIRQFKHGKYQALAHKLQRMESQVIIQGCCQELLDAEPDLQIGTVHDCLILPENYEDLAIDTLKEHFGRLGLNPSISRTTMAA